MKYKVFALDFASGVVEVPGTVDLFANGTELASSLFKIHLLSINCSSMPCAPSVPCQPCTPQQCTPCIPGNPGSQPCSTGRCNPL